MAEATAPLVATELIATLTYENHPEGKRMPDLCLSCAARALEQMADAIQKINVPMEIQNLGWRPTKRQQELHEALNKPKL